MEGDGQRRYLRFLIDRSIRTDLKVVSSFLRPISDLVAVDHLVQFSLLALHDTRREVGRVRDVGGVGCVGFVRPINCFRDRHGGIDGQGRGIAGVLQDATRGIASRDIGVG